MYSSADYPWGGEWERHARGGDTDRAEFYSLMERIAEWQPVQSVVRLAVENHSQPQNGNWRWRFTFNGQSDWGVAPDKAPLLPQLTDLESIFIATTLASEYQDRATLWNTVEQLKKYQKRSLLTALMLLFRMNFRWKKTLR